MNIIFPNAKVPKDNILRSQKIVSEREYGLIMPTIDLHCAIPYSLVVWFKS